MTFSLDADSAQILRRAIVAHRSGLEETAEALYLEILRRYAFHGDANHNLGVLKVSQGDVAGAMNYFKNALNSNAQVGED